VWTAGALSWILEADRRGVMAELMSVLDRRGARAGAADASFGYDVEAMKLALDEMVVDAGMRVQLHTRVVAASRDVQGRLTHIVTESKSGRQAWAAKVFVDATGDGDLSALAGCGFDYGHPATGHAQPMTLMALLTGLHIDDVDPFVAGGADPAGRTPGPRPRRYTEAKDRLLAELERAGIRPSYAAPTLWGIHDDLFALMANHEYGVSPMDAARVTTATMNARAEIHQIVAALRDLGGVWAGLRLVVTASQIGVREGRRVHGRYRITVDDLRRGTRHPDAVCHVTSGADVHALSPAEGGYLSRATEPLQDGPAATSTVAPVQPYDIPLRALIARDVDGLLLAGRCISGDFLAHASYRLTGYAVATGQAAGAAAALAARSGLPPHSLPWPDVDAAIAAIDSHAGQPA
jgi:hypothetical protein